MSNNQVILIADDDPKFTESNRDLLEAYGYTVYTAPDGARGLELARQLRPALMILAVMMTTHTEGFEIARVIRDQPELRDMKVLLVTGITKDLHLPFGFEPDKTWLPVDSVFEKPIDPQTLLAEIKKRIG